MEVDTEEDVVGFVEVEDNEELESASVEREVVDEDEIVWVDDNFVVLNGTAAVDDKVILLLVDDGETEFTLLLALAEVEADKVELLVVALAVTLTLLVVEADKGVVLRLDRSDVLIEELEDDAKAVLDVTIEDEVETDDTALLALELNDVEPGAEVDADVVASPVVERVEDLFRKDADVLVLEELIEVDAVAEPVEVLRLRLVLIVTAKVDADEDEIEEANEIAMAA